MTQPAAIATWEFGVPAVARSGEVLTAGKRCLDAVEQGIRVAELDPEETSVGHGGLPNAEGVVQLDAAIMDGLTHDSGAVAALEGFRTPISVARRVMERSRHAFLVADGARHFALREGFVAEETLTENARQRWAEWRASDDASPTHDTIGLVALDPQGDLAVGCSTSGIGFKDAGRVGDSPIVGSGLYVDNDVGGAAATGTGEVILRYCLSFIVVELMRQGRSPTEACEEAIKRIGPSADERGALAAAVIALSRDGDYGACSGRPGFSYGVWTPDGVHHQPVAARR